MSNLSPDPLRNQSAAASRHFIIGTAGHVDHGKTSLIRALTGVDTDRLSEERERGMSIDLGFADFLLPSGRHAGVIDVPGHERFLKNMLAGAGGVDLVLLVVAADEGVMPQTREHLDILSLLRTRRGVVVLTKADTVDPEWLELVQDELREALAGTFLVDAPMVPVNSIAGTGIPELKALLDRMADDVPRRSIVGPWRLPIDRAFTVGGFGTVVTGTLIAGVVRVGDRVELQPSGRESRVRSIQVHGASVDFAEAGSRVAVNLVGVDLGEIHRGDVASPPGTFGSTQSLDVRLEVLKNAPRAVKHRMRVRVYLGAAEVLARLHLLDSETLEPGANGLAQLRLESPLVAVRSDRFVIRLYSPMETLGGGTVIQTNSRRHRRSDSAVIGALTIREQGSPDEQLSDLVRRSGLAPAALETIAQTLGLAVDEVRERVQGLTDSGLLVPVGPNKYVHRHSLDAAGHQVLATLSAYHQSSPMLRGMSREELRSRLARWFDSKGFGLVIGVLEQQGTVTVDGSQIFLASHQPTFTPNQQQIREELETGLHQDPFNPPSLDDLLGVEPLRSQRQEVWEALIANGWCVRIASGVFLHQQAVDRAVHEVREYLANHSELSAAQFRDLLGTSRKVAVPLLEYLDSQKVTRRRGDVRELY